MRAFGRSRNPPKRPRRAPGQSQRAVHPPPFASGSLGFKPNQTIELFIAAVIQAESLIGVWFMANEFWLSDRQWAVIEPLLPKNQPGARRTDDRRVISGIVHVLKVGCRWQDCPGVYGPPTTVYNRFRRWTMRGLWRRLFEALTRMDPGDVQAIDSTTAKAHRSAAGGKGGPKRRRSAARGAGARRKSTRSSILADVPSPS